MIIALVAHDAKKELNDAGLLDGRCGKQEESASMDKGYVHGTGSGGR